MRDVARLTKKHPRLSHFLPIAIEEIRANPEAAIPVPGFGRRIWKQRVRDGTKGKRGALRLYYEWNRQENLVTLLRVVPKNEESALAATEIQRARERAGTTGKTR